MTPMMNEKTAGDRQMQVKQDGATVRKLVPADLTGNRLGPAGTLGQLSAEVQCVIVVRTR
jgi:hypothetical protein